MILTVVSIITSISIIIFSLYLVLSPFFQSKTVSYANHMDDRSETIGKKNLYASLNEIEMDYLMKKLSDEDYLKLKKQYESLITKILRDEHNDGLKPEEISNLKVNDEIELDILKEIEDEIEQDLKKIRQERREK